MSACDVTPSKLPIDLLIDQIKEEFAKSETPTPEAIKALLSAYITAGHQDWREFALFNSIKYSRNLLEFNENFELIVLCWLPGQESPIHNHSVRKRPFFCFQWGSTRRTFFFSSLLLPFPLASTLPPTTHTHSSANRCPSLIAA